MAPPRHPERREIVAFSCPPLRIRHSNRSDERFGRAWGPHVRVQTLDREVSPLDNCAILLSAKRSPEEGLRPATLFSTKKTPAQPPWLGEPNGGIGQLHGGVTEWPRMSKPPPPMV